MGIGSRDGPGGTVSKPGVEAGLSELTSALQSHRCSHFYRVRCANRRYQDDCSYFWTIQEQLVGTTRLNRRTG